MSKENIILDIYKLTVSMADNVSQRRQTANSFYLSINTLIVGANTYFQLSWMLSIAGIVICSLWIQNILSYKTLNEGKFRIINEIEKSLPIKPYTDEWNYLGRGASNSHYNPFHKVESKVPFVFMALYTLQIPWNSLWLLIEKLIQCIV